MVIICNCKHCIRTSGSGTEIIIGKRVADIDVDGVSLRDLAVNLHDLNILDGVIHIPKKKKKKRKDSPLASLPEFLAESESVAWPFRKPPSAWP